MKEERLRGLRPWWTLSSIVFAVQLIVLAVYGYFEFIYQPRGPTGLTFYHVYAAYLLYFLVLLFGLACAVTERSWLWGLIQIAVPALFCWYVTMPPPRYEAGDYQHLIGRTREDVESELSSRGMLTGSEGFGDVTYDFACYDGMTVYFDESEIVVGIRSDDWPDERTIPAISED